MTTEVLEHTKEVATISCERESLGLLASRIFWSLLTMVAAAFCLDFIGAPALQQTTQFLAGVAMASLIEPLSSIFYQKKMNNRSVRPFYMAAKTVGSVNAGGVVAVLALMFGDAAFIHLTGAVAGICGFVAGGVAASRVSMPDNGPVMAIVEKMVEQESPLSEEDRYLAAIHEAGHALALAVMSPESRAGAFVQIGGSRSTFTHVPQIEAMWSVAPYRRCQMLVLLGGPVATDLHFGASAEGGRQDMVEWRHKAMSVLTAERVEGWNPQPTDEIEYERNERLISQIETEQSAALAEFFTINEALYYQLVEFLFEHRGASESELESFLLKAQRSERIQEVIS